MGERTVAKCVLRVCNAIIEVLTPIEMPEPTAATWLHSARLFHEMWQFPHCIAAIDGKHVQILAPKNSGSMFHNYKHTKSIVLLTLVDASYRFVVADVGAFGKNSDGGILSRSEMGQRFARNEMDIPEADLLPGSTVTAPYTMVGDEAFACRTICFVLIQGHRRETIHPNADSIFVCHGHDESWKTDLVY